MQIEKLRDRRSSLEEVAKADYIHIPPQTPALDKGGASGKAMPCWAYYALRHQHSLWGVMGRNGDWCVAGYCAAV